ncbi:MAG TPA: SgcJ/EcaC family oxidoreductase [Phenylobacterium sp.]|jgi:uncharacterized protein (TIGR02246 family)
MPPTPRAALASLALFAAGSPAATAPASAAAATAVLQQGYIGAWDRADPTAIAAFFAPDGDFTNPTGFHATGRAAIAAFYAQAFAAGYAGSHGGFKPLRARYVAPEVIVIDGEWSIRDAHTPQGAARPGEQGLATAILVRKAGAWRIAALREQEPPTP